MESLPDGILQICDDLSGRRLQFVHSLTNRDSADTVCEVGLFSPCGKRGVFLKYIPLILQAD